MLLSNCKNSMSTATDSSEVGWGPGLGDQRTCGEAISDTCKDERTTCASSSALSLPQFLLVASSSL